MLKTTMGRDNLFKLIFQAILTSTEFRQSKHFSSHQLEAEVEVIKLYPYPKNMKAQIPLLFPLPKQGEI